MSSGKPELLNLVYYFPVTVIVSTYVYQAEMIKLTYGYHFEVYGETANATLRVCVRVFPAIEY